MIKVTVWNEGRHEKTSDEVRAVYPDGIHRAIADFLGEEAEFVVRTATLDDPECGLPQNVVDDTDVMLWWGHMAHNEVPDEVADRVVTAVQNGMGLIALHSAHHSKVFRRLMGTPCHLGWRENGDMERVWVVDPAHPITQGIDRYFELPHVETYAEPFSIPEPERLLFIGAYEGGEVFRSGCLWRRGNGTVFYFQPGHETFPIYYVPAVQTVIKNAVRYCAPVVRQQLICPHIEKI